MFKANFRARHQVGFCAASGDDLALLLNADLSFCRKSYYFEMRDGCCSDWSEERYNAQNLEI